MRAFTAKISANTRVALALTALFIGMNSLLVAYEFFYLAVLPALLLLLWYYFVSPDKVLIAIAFFVPLSVDLSSWDMRLGVSLPAEPLLAGLLLLFLMMALGKNKLDKRIFVQSISFVFYAYFAWMLLTTLTSEFPMVSLKSMIAKMWFIIPSFFFATLVFKDVRKPYGFLWAYILGFIGVIIYTIIHHAQFGFTTESSHWVMSPFYKDHTSYGAMLAMFIPVLLGFLFMRRYRRGGLKYLIFTVLALFLAAVVLSVSRAAWASLMAAFAVFFVVYYRIKMKYLLSLAAFALLIILGNKEQILMKLEKNKQDAKGGLIEHVESVSNVATDASNLERINRWASAIRMFKTRPFFGWGPGTYQFVYAPFQKSYEKTVISTNAGNRGTAHSEYLLILSEEGLFGGLILLVLFALVVSMALSNHKHLNDHDLKILNLTTFLGLLTYMTHAFFNNFLDTDKAAVPFWGMVAIIMALNLRWRYTPEDGKEQSRKSLEDEAK